MIKKLIFHSTFQLCLPKNISKPKAFAIFRDFKFNVEYVNPKIQILIKDESILVKDLIKTIKSAKKSLMKEERKEKRDLAGYDIGFVKGFITGSLQTHWINEYINKQSDAYKEFIVFKAAKTYLELFEIDRIKIDAMYKELYLNDTNFLEPSLDLETKKVGLDVVDVNIKEYKSFVLKTLENNIIQYLKNYLNRKNSNYFLSMDLYFTGDEIQHLIDNKIKIAE